jgi:hypothetical protein
MTERLGRHLGLLAFLLLCSAGTLLAGWNMRNWGNALSPVDSFSEEDALREVDGFRAQGLAHDAGLGNVLFGHRYPGKGFPNTFEFKQNVTTDSGVYTHALPARPGIPAIIQIAALQARADSRSYRRRDIA